jgi:NHLM bacteriocin system ABC transporter ATP-binding protein
MSALSMSARDWTDRLVLTGATHEARADRPFALAGNGAWLIRDGRIDVFSVPLERGAPAGSRRHLFRADPGQLLFGINAPGRTQRVELLAVGSTGTRVAALPAQQLRELAAQPEYAGLLGTLLDDWIEHICAGLLPGAAPAECRELAPGEHSPAEAAYARPSRRIVWVRHNAGNSRLLGRAPLTIKSPEPTPISRQCWLEVTPGSQLCIEETADLVQRGEAWSGLDQLHELLLDGLVDIAERTTAQERDRLRRRGIADRVAYRTAQRGLAAAMRARTTSPVHATDSATDSPDTPQHLLLTACRTVGAVLGIDVHAPPEVLSGDQRGDLLAAIARASRFRTRQVLLRDGWWRQDLGPLIAFLEADQRPVALLPGRRRRYALHDPATQQRVDVDGNVAETIAPFAHTIYRPFGDAPLGIIGLLRFALRGSVRDLAIVVLMGAAVGLLSLVTPVATSILFNDVLPSAARSQIVQLMAVLVAIAMATTLFNVVSASALVRVEGRMSSATQSGVWDRLLALPLPFFRSYTAGNLATRAMGIDAIRQILSGATVSALLGGIFSIFHFILLVHYGGKLALWASLLIAVAVVVTVVAARIQIVSERKVAGIRARLAGKLLQFLSSITKLRVAGAEVYAFAGWARDFSEQRRIEYKVRSIANGLAAFNAGFPTVATLAIFALAMPVLRSGMELRTGDFLAFMSSFGLFLTGTLNATSAALQTLKVVPLYEQARPILVARPEAETHKTDPGVLTGDIEIQHIRFRYNEEAPLVLHDVSLNIRPGEFIALAGPSGSGKSTILRLLLHFEAPEAGAIYYDGQDLSGLDIQAVRRQIGVVLQHGRLMAGDIFTNIAGSSLATQAEAWEAARMAGLDADIRAMPMGMHTVISEGGGTLSGGQRQRLLIARALVRKPRIIVLDEATSALDNRTQAIVSESLERLQATRIVIAHRLSTIMRADRIHVLQRGRIVESGTYDELRRNNGLFAELARRQLT